LIVLGMLCSSTFAMAQSVKPITEQFQELADPTADTLSDWSKVKQGLHSSFVTIDKRFPKSVAPDLAKKQTQFVQGWKGERVSAQVLLWTAAEVKQAEVRVSDFKGEQGATLPQSIASTHFVRYVMTDEFAG